MTDLTAKKCKPCQGGAEALDEDRARDFLERVDGWSLSDGAKEIHRTFEFENYHGTMAFVNAVAWIAHREDHHPDMEVGYSRCTVRYSTHSVGGLSENDFICAAKIDRLLKE